MKIVIEHTMSDELREQAEITRKAAGRDLDKILNEAAEKIKRAWIISLVGTGILAFGVGYVVGKSN